MNTLPPPPILSFCKAPSALAKNLFQSFKLRLILFYLMATFSYHIGLAQVPWSGTALTGNTHRLDNVGIGLTTPAHLLHLEKAGGVQGIFVNSLENAAYLRLSSNNDRPVEIYSPNNSADLRFLVNSIDRMTINQNGNVGIGTVTPAHTLHLERTGIQGIFVNSTDNSAFLRLSSNNSGPVDIYTPNGSADLRFLVNGADRMSINSIGNVGLGTITPSQRLELSTGNIKLADVSGGITGNILLGGVTFNNELGMRLFAGNEFLNGSIDVRANDPGRGLTFRVDQSNRGTERMRITADGRVGIGTTTPAGELDVVNVSASSRPLIRLVSGTGASESMFLAGISAGAGDYFGISQDNDVIIKNYGGSTNNLIIANERQGRDIIFGTANPGAQEVMRVTSTGNVGIGITSPTSKLHVIGSGRIVGSVAVGNANNLSAGVNAFSGGDASSASGAGALAFGGTALASGRYSVALGGDGALGTKATGDGSVAIGNGGITASGINSMALGIGTLNNTINNSLMVGFNNTVNTPTLFVGTPSAGQSIGNVGIGTSSPTARLHVVGTVRIEGGNPALNRILTSDANGNATWQDPQPAGWALAGNSITSGQFLGTTNNEALSIRTGNVERINVSSIGSISIPGDVGIGNTPLSTYHLRIGSSIKNGIFVASTEFGLNSSASNFGASATAVRGYALNCSTGYGVYGYTHNALGVAYGVYGKVDVAASSGNYAIYGDASGLLGSTQWAGYFNGKGFLSNGPWSTSDRKLKTNLGLASFSKKEVLENISVYNYTFKQDLPTDLNLPKEKQYGFIAQEIEKYFPEFVIDTKHPGSFDTAGNRIYEDFEFKAINQSSLLPVLWAIVQDLQKQVDDLSGVNRKSLNIDIISASDRKIGLKQNYPNPWDRETTIEYQLPEGCKQALIMVTDMTGASIKQFDLNLNDSKLVIQSGSFQSGTYIYLLVADGVEVDSKKMIVTK